MSEQLKAYWEKFREWLKKVSKKAYVIAAVALVLVAAVIVIVLNSKPYDVLVTGVNSSEAASILTYLESLGVTDYRVEGSDTILVSKNQVDSLRARILMEGYPQTGYVFDSYYERVGALSTESERDNAYLISIMESMSNTIRTFENVKDATVYITPGEDRGYVLDSGNVVKASASVIVTMNGAAKLSSQQVTAIRNMVAYGVQGLEVDSVAISDTMGNNYTADEAAAAGDSSALKLQLEEEYENKIRTEVMKAMVAFFGEENVRVSVNCVVELSQRTVSSRDVQLPNWAQDGSTDGKGIIGSQIYEYYVARPGEDTVGGLVGSETNSDIPEYVENTADPNGTETALGGSGQTDYDNPYTETQAVYTAGYLTDCTVAVSINSKSAGNVNMDEMRRHVARAAGINGRIDEVTGEEYLADKISIVSMEFYYPNSPGGELPGGPTVPLWVLAAAAGGLLLFVILLIVILMIRRRRRKKSEARQRVELDQMLAAAGLTEVPVPMGADVMTLQTEKSMELRKNIRQFANDNPEITAQMVRGWLRGGDDNG